MFLHTHKKRIYVSFLIEQNIIMFRFEGKGIHIGPKTSTQLYYMGKHYNFFVQLMNVGSLVQKRWSPVRWLKSKLSFSSFSFDLTIFGTARCVLI